MEQRARFELVPEWRGPCAKSAVIDVNLGHAPEAFVDAAHYQISGEPAPAELVARWSERLRADPRVRRVDVVRTLCRERGRECALSYSDPWLAQPELLGGPPRAVERDVGAVFMFFFGCPGGVNCGMDWANTHALGMDRKHELFGFEPHPAGFYSAAAAGFWRRELLEAEYAGLQFLLLNVYGPDLEDGKLAPLTHALNSLRDPPKLALFDDTWAWDKPWFGEFWKQKPDFSRRRAHRTDAFSRSNGGRFTPRIDRRHWYRFKGRPLSTSTTRGRSGRVIARPRCSRE
jgi:hypothetical protein